MLSVWSVILKRLIWISNKLKEFDYESNHQTPNGNVEIGRSVAQRSVARTNFPVQILVFNQAPKLCASVRSGVVPGAAHPVELTPVVDN